MTGPQNQLGVQDTTNLWRQKGGGRGAASAWASVRVGDLGAEAGIAAQALEWAEVWSQTPGTAGQQVSVCEPRLAHSWRGLTSLAAPRARHMPPVLGGESRHQGTVGAMESHHCPPPGARAATWSHLLVPAVQPQDPPHPGRHAVDKGHPHPTSLTPTHPSAYSSLLDSALTPASAWCLLLQSAVRPGPESQGGWDGPARVPSGRERGVPSNILQDEGQPALGAVAVPTGARLGWHVLVDGRVEFGQVLLARNGQ